MQYIEVHITDYSEKNKLRTILIFISRFLGISIDDLRSRKQNREFTDGRFLYFAIAKETTNKSLNEIGGFVSKDHATVLHGIRQVKNVPELTLKYEIIKRKFITKN